MHRQRREQSGTMAFDDALVERFQTCTACGTHPPSRDALADIVMVPGFGLVHILICHKCARRWERVEPVLLAKLEARYRGRGEH